MFVASEYAACVEDGLSEREAPPSRARLWPRLALAAGLLALVGCAAVQLQGSGAAGGAPARAPAAASPVSLAEDFSATEATALAAEEKHAPTEAVGRSAWSASEHENCVDIIKGARYWVEDRRADGWSYVYTFDYFAHGWAPDSALYHGEATIVRKAYSADGFSVSPGDSVWILDQKDGQDGGAPMVYVLYEDKEAWIDESAVHEGDVFHPTPCYVKKSYDAGEDATHLTVAKGEVIWTSASPDPDAAWVRATSDQGQKGWVPRDCLVETPSLPVLQTFNGDSKVQSELPEKLLYVGEGESVWVESHQSKAGWIYCFQHGMEGYVPEWALMEVTVDNQYESPADALADEGKEPSDKAPSVPSGTDDAPDARLGAVTEAADETKAPTEAPAPADDED